MDRLEELIHIGQFRETPVELLTLSACQTALGDERAALGLAGVAIRAGARSALSTLWSVHDAVEDSGGLKGRGIAARAEKHDCKAAVSASDLLGALSADRKLDVICRVGWVERSVTHHFNE